MENFEVNEIETDDAGEEILTSIRFVTGTRHGQREEYDVLVTPSRNGYAAMISNHRTGHGLARENWQRREFPTLSGAIEYGATLVGIVPQ